MPVQSRHVFASHIGHTGKTTFTYQMSSYYAKRHPDKSVLVMDFAEEGDLTKRLLGGVDASSKLAESLFGGVFNMLGEARDKSKGLSGWIWATQVEVEKHAIRIADYNKSVPPNLYLMSSGAWPRDDQEMDSATRKQLRDMILKSLEKSTATWKLFCDTDGDRRPSSLTMLGYSLCPEAIIPLHLNKGDLDRTETMLGLMHDLRQKREIETQVLFVVWNFVKLLKEEPCSYQGRLGNIGLELPFTPTKVNLDILYACNERLYKISQDLPGLFVHHAAGEQNFVKSGTAIQRQLADNVLKPSEEMGKPFVQMVDDLAASGKKSMKFKTGSVEYDTKADVIQGVDKSMLELMNKFEDMTLG